MLEPDHLIDFAERYTAAWCSQNAATVAAFFSPTGSLCINGGVPAVGRPAITEAAQAFMSAFPDLEVTMDRIILQDKRAVYHWTLSGANRGPGGTGRRVHISGFEVWKFGDDGLIVESLGNFDSANYQQQVGHGTETAR